MADKEDWKCLEMLNFSPHKKIGKLTFTLWLTDFWYPLYLFYFFFINELNFLRFFKLMKQRRQIIPILMLLLNNKFIVLKLNIND
jgi:hypothetical protein